MADKIDKKIDVALKKRSRKDLLSVTSIAFLAWALIVLILPYILTWLGMGASFWDSIEFQGMVSLVVLVLVLISFAVDAVKK